MPGQITVTWWLFMNYVCQQAFSLGYGSSLQPFIFVSSMQTGLPGQRVEETPWLFCQEIFLPGLAFHKKSSSSAYLVTELLSTPKNLCLSLSYASQLTWTIGQSLRAAYTQQPASLLQNLQRFPTIRSIKCEFLNQAVTVLYLVQTSSV